MSVDTEETILKRIIDKVIQKFILPEPVFWGKFWPCPEDGWSSIQGHVLVRFLNPNVYTQVLLCIPFLLKLSGEKPSAKRNAWGSVVYSFSRSGFVILSASPTYDEWHNPIFHSLWKGFLIQEKGGTSLQSEFKLLPYFSPHKLKKSLLYVLCHSQLTPKLTRRSTSCPLPTTCFICGTGAEGHHFNNNC